MQILTTISDTRRALKLARSQNPIHNLGLVPTMGALHAGHLSLVRAARGACNLTAVSLFVNPLQFAPTEDLSTYPRTFDRDCELLTAAGVDFLFAPTPDEMYSLHSQTVIDIPLTGSLLDGASRPGHFRGVATVVTKLFHIVQPDLAFFGQKDAAQVAVLRALIDDLNFPIDLIACPTVRDADGLALSSRNQNLSPTERRQAHALYRALRHVELRFAHGERDAASLRTLLRENLLAAPGLRLDYADIVHADTLLPVTGTAYSALVAVAAFFGRTRLIDNILFPPEELIA